MSPAAAVARWLCWSIGLFVLYVAFVHTLAPAELVAGAVCAAISAGLATWVAAQGLIRLGLRPGDLRRTWRPFAQSAPDVVVLTRALWRRVVRREEVRGAFRVVRFRAGGSSAEGRRALAEGLGSLAPNTYVLGIDTDDELILVHQLVPTPGDVDSADPLRLG